MENFFLFIFFLSTQYILLAQFYSSFVIFVSDKETGNPIPGASRIIKAGWVIKITRADGKAHFDKPMPIGVKRL